MTLPMRFPLFIALTATPCFAVDFVSDVRPIFESHCYECHGPDKQKSDYRLDIKTVALTGGESHAPNIVPGTSASSTCCSASSAARTRTCPCRRNQSSPAPRLKRCADGSRKERSGRKTTRTKRSSRTSSPMVELQAAEARSLGQVAERGHLRSGEARRERSRASTSCRCARFDPPLVFRPHRPTHTRRHRPLLAGSQCEELEQPALMHPWSMTCSPALVTANAGLVTGWTWFTTARRTAMTRTSHATMPGPTATT